MKYNYFKKLSFKHWVIAFVLACFLVAVKLAIIMEQKSIPDVSTLISKIVKKVSDKIDYVKPVQQPGNTTPRKSSNQKSVVKPKTLYKDWVKLSWVAPTEYTNGEPLHDLAGFYIYYWKEGDHEKQKLDVKNVLSYKLEKLQYGETYYFAVTAYNKNFVESVYSNIKAVKLEKPV
jgi:hypothetical protein